jgi:hypothetical protein
MCGFFTASDIPFHHTLVGSDRRAPGEHRLASRFFRGTGVLAIFKRSRDDCGLLRQMRASLMGADGVRGLPTHQGRHERVER